MDGRWYNCSEIYLRNGEYKLQHETILIIMFEHKPNWGKEKVNIINTKERIGSFMGLLLVVHIRGLVPRLKPARRGARSLEWRLLQQDLRTRPMRNWRFPTVQMLEY